MKKKTIYISIIILIISIIMLFFKSENKISLAADSSYDSDLHLLARVINGEARGESYEGQVAIAAVVLNRVKSPEFPNSVSGVVYQTGAFTAITDGQIEAEMEDSDTAYKAARDAMNGWDPTNGCTYYFNPDTATNSWIWSKTIVKSIGKHNFCK